MLNPALSVAAADRFGDGPAAGRAATLVTATQSLTAMLAAPVVALPALLWGWRGDLLAVAAVSIALATLFVRRGKGDARASAPKSDSTLGYVASFRALGAVPGAVPLLLIALLRTGAFMGYLAYLAAFYDERFGLSPGLFAFVWTLSGASFFVGNLFIGRYANSTAPRIGPERLLTFGLVAALLAIVGVYFAPALPVALLMTALLGASHATVAACIVSLLVRRCRGLRGAALSLNAAGMSLGVFVGAAVGGAGLGLAGYPGMAVALGALTLAGLAVALMVRWSDTSHPGAP